MKSVKVNDLNLSDKVVLAHDIERHVGESVSFAVKNALSNVSFSSISIDSPIYDIICALSSCVTSIVTELGGKISSMSPS